MNDRDTTSPAIDPLLVPEQFTALPEVMVIPVIEEQVQVEKEVVETGRLVVSKVVRNEEQVVVTPLTHQEISVVRVPVNQYVQTAPAVRYEGDLTIIPVLKEMLVVEKRLMLVEEVHITKRQLTTDDTQNVTLRREEVMVERVAPETDVRPEARPSL